MFSIKEKLIDKAQLLFILDLSKKILPKKI